jgi:predicted dehydrogenase
MAIKVAITGLGTRGHDWIKEVNASRGFELCAYVDIDERVVAKTAKTYQIPETRCYNNLEKALIENDNCQAVIVVTPADQHYKDCQTALSRGKAVLVEKPFTTSLAEARQLVLLAEAKGVPLIVAQNYRYLRSYRAVRRLIREGRLGRIGMVICQYYRGPHKMSLAHARARQSILWGIGVHHLDALRYVLETEVNNVISDDFTLEWTSLPKGASMRAMLSFETGARAFYTATYESSGHEFFERGQEFYARFVGELGTLHVFQRWLLLCEKGKLPRLLRRGARKISEEQILLNQLERAMLVGETPESTGRDNLQTMAVIEACLRSSAEKKWTNPQELLNEFD